MALGSTSHLSFLFAPLKLTSGLRGCAPEKTEIAKTANTVHDSNERRPMGIPLCFECSGRESQHDSEMQLNFIAWTEVCQDAGTCNHSADSTGAPGAMKARY